jgi:hypothetical protein
MAVQQSLSLVQKSLDYMTLNIQTIQSQIATVQSQIEVGCSAVLLARRSCSCAAGRTEAAASSGLLRPRG